MSKAFHSVTIGNFDGVHLGHRELIRELMAGAPQASSTLVITFRPHPKHVLRASVEGYSLLTSYDDKVRRLKDLGIGDCVEIPFTESFSKQSGSTFFLDLLKKFSMKRLIVGHDFGFGQNRQSGLDELKSLCVGHQVAFECFGPFKENGVLVSSGLVRKLLKDNQLEEANRYLGEPLSYEGEVVSGQKMGGKIGYPTANLTFEGEMAHRVQLPLGVYATETLVGGKKLKSITNIGSRVTFTDAKKIWIETHIPGFDQPLYGQKIQVWFLWKIRDEKKFESIEALKAQISLDIKNRFERHA